jgi:excisionase family DNA binding protein
MINKENEEYITIEEACAILRVSRKTLERYTAASRIKKYRRGVRNVIYNRSEVERLKYELSIIRPGNS